jgi:hypothetical protein
MAARGMGIAFHQAIIEVCNGFEKNSVRGRRQRNTGLIIRGKRS